MSCRQLAGDEDDKKRHQECYGGANAQALAWRVQIHKDPCENWLRNQRD